MDHAFDADPTLHPDLAVRFSASDGMSLDDYWVFRRTVTNELSRAGIDYGLFTSFAPFLHDSGFTRGASRGRVVAAIKRAAKRCGITLSPGQFAVAKVHTLEGYTGYLTKAEEVDGPSPHYYRVFTSSRRLLSVGLTNGRTLMWLLKASHPDPRQRRGSRPSDAALERLLIDLRRRRKDYGA